MSVPSILRTAARNFLPPGRGSSRLRCRALSSCSNTRKMSSKRQMDHLEKTSKDYRQNAVYPAQVCGIIQESDTVKRLRISVHPDFTFKAGQWVDFFIPGVEKVGGFSMCSCPGLLQREGVIELAVKKALHPPAHWIHTACTVGAHVAMRVGGNFFFDPRPTDPPADLLLVAGGVGINPLYSVLLHAAHLARQHHASGGRDYRMGSAHMLYSAKSVQELLFKNTILELSREFPGQFSCDLRVTEPSQDPARDQDILPVTRRGRITEADLRAHVDPQRTLCYLCGPPPMIEAISQSLIDLGLPKDRILFEKWW
ncbi:oxidoreductase NAD-binding domain-containing protein 1 isoform X1 [Gadus morhua]|uniref:Oxidoreductase NAD-binding domain-containing protein 1 n=2 Tax=Gadus morhua TaxID=8049 RepID=A0A8C4ZFU5_GADMO|nr:oxidoreductase NAD-binding domain-containing protein 1 isoform X1 [Gadus morhua]